MPLLVRAPAGILPASGSYIVRLKAGVRVRIYISSIDITLSGSYGIRPAPVNPP